MENLQNISYYQKRMRQYAVPHDTKAWFQLWTSLIISLGLIIFSHVLFYSYGWSINIFVSLLAGLSIGRPFIFQHDCGHGSFFKESKINNLVGSILSILTHIPYKAWRESHSIHHNYSSNIHFSNIGDMETYTVEQYHNLKYFDKLWYRLFRNPILLFGPGALIYIMLHQRIPMLQRKHFDALGERADVTYENIKKTRTSLLYTNAVLVFVYIIGVHFFGWGFLINQCIIMWAFGSASLWLFYVQHQFESVYKTPVQTDWSYLKAALYGSSYYKLPKFFQWLTGNIGFHYLHHLNDKIPNYNLEQCHYDNLDIFSEHLQVLDFRKSLKSLELSLYDDVHKKMITFNEYRNRIKKCNINTS